MNEFVLKIIQYAEVLINKNFNGINLKNLLLTMPFEDVVELICLDEEIIKMINNYDCFEQFVNFLRQIKYEENNKIIKSITNNDILFSKGSIKNYSLSTDEMPIVFSSLKRNLEIYEKIYMNKVYKIETTFNRTILLNIGHAKLFHLLGFNFIDMQRHYRTEILRVVPEMKEVLSKDYPDMCMRNDASLLKALISIIKREEDIILAVSGQQLSDEIFTSPKIKTKNFAFERLGLIESPTGIVFSAPTRTIKSDIFVLRDFIRDYELNWIFNGYAHERQVSLSKTLGNSKKIVAKNAETLLIEPDDSYRFNGNLVGVSSSIGSMNKSVFDFKVSTLISDEDAVDVIPTDFEFEQDDIKFMAEKIIFNFPNLNLTNLEKLLNNKSNRK